MRSVLEPFYWRFQLLGWAFFCLLNLFYGYFLFDSGFRLFILDFLMQWLTLVVGSHLICLWTDYRGWFRLSPGKLWIRAPVICLIAGLVLAGPHILLYFRFLRAALSEMIPAFRPVLDMADTMGLPLLMLPLAIQIGTKLMFWYLIVWMIQQQRMTATIHGQLRTSELELRSAQLDVLWQQLKPHFLFNCLNSIRAMIHINIHKSSDMVGELTHILRYTLQAPRDRVALSEELQAVDSYLSLEKARLGRRLTIEKQIDKASFAVRLPPLLVHTVVENAVRHGISRMASGGVLKLIVTCEPEGLRIVVRNDGDLNSEVSGFGVGLKNSRERLQLLYGRDDLLQVAQEGAQVVSTLFIPSETGSLGRA